MSPVVGSGLNSPFARAKAALTPAHKSKHHREHTNAEPDGGILPWTAGALAAGTLGSEEHGDPEKGRGPSRSSASQPSISVADYKDKGSGVRALPPWVMSPHEEEGESFLGIMGSHQIPGNTKLAHHNSMPAPKEGAVAGRGFDHAREQQCVTITHPITDEGSRWKSFARPASGQGRSTGEYSDEVHPEWLDKIMPDLEKPWAHEPLERRNRWRWLSTSEIRRILMRNPVIPLIVRLTVVMFSLQALGIASSIFKRTGQNGCPRGSSTWLAIIVDVVAVIYTCYITYDEYTSRPLGLRSPRAKMRLIFLDLVFIVFDSANLSLAFESLTDDRWVCKAGDDSVCVENNEICDKQKALAATLFIALIAWIATFAISTFRVVERVSNR